MKAHNHYPALTALFSALTVLAQMASQAGQFQPASSMNVGRVSHTATLLQNGKVLVTGGRSGYGPPPPGGVDQTPIIEGSAELYDPTTDTWTPTGSMITAREMHAALLLTNGEVLVVGGQNFVIMTVGDYEYPAVQHLYSAEIYDPVTEAWRPAADAPG